MQISPVNILLASKTSSRRLQDMPWRRLQDMSSRRLQDMSLKHLEDMFSKRLEDVFSVTIFLLPKRKIVMLKTCWRRLKDISWRPTNVCWVVEIYILGVPHFIYRNIYQTTKAYFAFTRRIVLPFLYHKCAIKHWLIG